METRTMLTETLHRVAIHYSVTHRVLGILQSMIDIDMYSISIRHIEFKWTKYLNEY